MLGSFDEPDAASRLLVLDTELGRLLRLIAASRP